MNRATHVDALRGASALRDPWFDHYERLAALGAGEFAHVAGTLAPHLRETAALLARWGNREALCMAGLYHAVYGTAGIHGALVAPAQRAVIADAIGAEAEAIVYLYGACDRDAFHPRIGTPHEARFVDRFSGSEYPISQSALDDFCELTIANEFELARTSAAFCAKHGTSIAHLAERMHAHVGSAALAACRGLA
jgi:hypothetical protein